LPKKQTKTKKTAGRKKLTATTIASSATLSPPLNNFNEESNDSIPDTLPEPPRKRKYTKRDKGASAATASAQHALPSPSPPSSDTEDESSDGEEEEKSKISRIRELAAKATKQLKKIEKQSVKTKGKGPRVVKMEVQTVSQKVSIEHPPNATEPILPAPAKLEVNPPAVAVAPAENKSIVTLPPTPQSPITPQSPTSPTDQQPKQGGVGRLSPRSPSSRSLKQEKPINIKPTREKVKVSRIDKAILEDDDDDDEDDGEEEVLSPQTSPSIPPMSPPFSDKLSFKIPKRTHGENGQVSSIYFGVCVPIYCFLCVMMVYY